MHSPPRIAAWLLNTLFVGAVCSAAAGLDYQKDVRPILSDHCFKCHGTDITSRKGGLRLDIREGALKPSKSGLPAIVALHPEKSGLISRIETLDEDEIMPPPAAKKPLDFRQKNILKQWISSGAPYSLHWAYIKPQASAIPKIESPSPAHNPIDHFIQARSKQEGLSAAEPAGPVMLLRRVTLDLIGLPATEVETAHFLSAWTKDPDTAYESLVTRLLNSPHYGERWARRWLDLARYADTNGYEKDRFRSIWPYRDWVIQALNKDMPFDRFTIEQLAGDMLPNATLQQKIATGFQRNTMLNEEGGIDPLEFRYHAMVDRVATTGTTWLGLTVGCAQCHTHKFDPIQHTEYFGLMAFLDNADEPDLDLPTTEAEAKRRENLATAAKLLEALPARWPVKEPSAPEAVRHLAADAAFVSWREREHARNLRWHSWRPNLVASNLPILTVQPDDSVFGSGDISKADTYELSFGPTQQEVTAIRLEAMPDERLPAHGPGMAYYEGPKGDFFLGEFQVSVNGNSSKIQSATESYSKNHFGNNPATASLAIDGDPQTGWSCAGRYGERHEAVFVLTEAAPKGSIIRVKMLFGRHYACSLGRFRISGSGNPGAVARNFGDDLAALLQRPLDELSRNERQSLFEHFLLHAPELAAESKRILTLLTTDSPITTLVMRERPANEPRRTFLHHRGEFSQPKEQIEPHTLAFLHSFPKDLPRNRLGFAQWLASPENPLTPRVVMNRAWAAFFGRGIVKTVQDFGYQGDYPTHPELLDWLAVEFIRSGWSMKHMHQLIVMSATYRQSSQASAEAVAKDPENRFLSHAPRVRLDAELIRDSVLLASGLLNPQIGGPSVFPPQPDGATEAAYGKGDWTASTGPDRYRRGLYTYMKRTAPFAMFNTFDGPTGEGCLANRETSNTPLQALTLLNDISIQEAVQALGKKLAASAASDADRVRELFQRCLCRQPTADETEALLRFVQKQSKTAGGKADSALPWTLAARAVFNLDEFVTKQ